MKTLDTLIRQSEEKLKSKFFSGVYSVDGILIEEQLKSFLSSEIRRVVEHVVEDLEVEHQIEMERTVNEIEKKFVSAGYLPEDGETYEMFTQGKWNKLKSRLQIQKKGKEVRK